MFEKLPLEILATIADILQTNDKKSCSTVCKRWKTIFQKSLWKVVKISKRSWIQSFEKRVKDDVLRENYHHVQSIEIYNIISRTDNIFPLLVNIFPQVKTIFYSEAHCNIRSLTIANLSGWKLLTHMYIQLEYHAKLIIPEDLFKSLSVLPSLVHFTISQKSPFNLRTAITWRQIEQLHFHLPRLQYLKCWTNLREINPIDIDDLQKITPANSLKAVDYGSSRFNIQWIYYIGLKYPRLERLNLTIDKESTSYSDSQDGNEAKVWPDLPCFFPCLKSIYTTDNGESGFELSVLYSQISKGGAKLESIETSLFHNTDDAEFPANETACVQVFFATLKKLRIFKYRNVSNTFTPFWQAADLAEFSRLVYLRISSYSPLFEVDNVLDVCPSLVVLKASHMHITTRIKHHAFTSKHGLQHLKIDNASTCQEFFEYISSRCRDLKHLSLTCAEIRSTNSEKTKRLTLSMPFTQLLTLSLCHVHLSDYTSLNFSTGQSCRYNTLAENGESYFTEIYLYYTRGVETCFCTLSEKTISELNIVQKIKSVDAGYFLEYFGKPKEENKSCAILSSKCFEKVNSNDSSDLSKEGVKDDEYFKANIEHCCVVFQCRSIKQVIIDKSSFYSCMTPYI